MARKKDKVPVSDVAQAVQLLREGKPAPAWACRELLDLGMTNSPADVVRALHNGIHGWQREVGTLDAVNVRVAAAYYLLLSLNDGKLPEYG